jgi:hypothetical protein
MSSLLDTEGRALLASIIAAHGGVTVRYGAQTGTGLQVLRNKQTTQSVLGQAGETISTVRVSAADIDEPTRGARVQVDGQQVFVLACRTSCGVRVLECSDTQPVEGV